MYIICRAEPDQPIVYYWHTRPVQNILWTPLKANALKFATKEMTSWFLEKLPIPNSIKEHCAIIEYDIIKN